METGTILSIIQICAKTGALLYQIQDAYSTANETLTAMALECGMLEDVLYKVGEMASSSQVDRLQTHSGFRQSLEQTLTTCNWTLTLISCQLKRLGAPDQNISDTWIVKWSRTAKFKFLWRGSTMKEYLGHLRGHTQALNLLLTTFSVQAMFSFNEEFRRLQPQVQQINEGVQEILRKSEEPMSPSRQSNYVESIIHGPAVSVVPRERWQRNSQRRDEATASDASLGTDRFLWAIQTATPGWSRNQILHSLRQIREFGDADDYTLACEAISLNGHDLQKCSALLTQIRRFGSKEDYSDALLIVASYEEDLTSTRDWLWRIRGLGSQEDYTIALATTTTHCFDFKNVEATLKWFWELSQGASNYSLTLKFLRSRSYVFSSTKDDLLKLKRVTGDPQQYFHALLLLEGSNFSIEDTLKQLHNDAQAPLPQPPSITVNYSSSHIFNPPFPGGFAPQVAPYPPALPIHNDRPFQFPTPSTSRDTNTASLGSTAGRVVASKRSLPPESALNAPTSSNHRRQRSSQAALAGGKGPVTDSRSDSNRLFARLYPSPQEQREIARNYRVSGRKLEELLQALNQLNLRGAELIYLGKILRRQTFDYDGVQRQVLEVASTLPDRLDFSWALEFLSQFLGDWMAMRSIFGPDVSGVQTLVSFFRTREISAQIIIDYLSTDGPKGKDAQRCALKLWQRYNLGRQGATEEINNLLQLAKGNSGMFSVILYLLEKNNFDREKTPGHWASLIKAMGGERSDKCVQRMETYALQGLKSTPEAPESTVNGFLRLLALTRSGPYSTVSDDDNLDAGLQLLQSTNFNFQEVINVLSAHRGLTASKLVGGFPVLLKLAKDGRYNLVEAHQTIAYFLGPQMSLTDVEAVRLLEKHQWSKDALLASRSLA